MHKLQLRMVEQTGQNGQIVGRSEVQKENGGRFWLQTAASPIYAPSVETTTAKYPRQPRRAGKNFKHERPILGLQEKPVSAEGPALGLVNQIVGYGPSAGFQHNIRHGSLGGTTAPSGSSPSYTGTRNRCRRLLLLLLFWPQSSGRSL